MKKQHSVTDICLSILRGGLCLAVAVSIIKYIIDTSSRDYIVISALPRTTTSAGTAEYTPAVESTAPTETTAKESGAEEPVEIPVTEIGSSVSEVTYKAESPQEVYTSHITTVSSAASEKQSDSPGLVNINTASAQQLMELSGIGEVRADAIVRYREENGVFGSIDEILNVKGIGEKTFEKIRSQITV